MAKRRAKAGTRKSGRKTQTKSRRGAKKSSARRLTSRKARSTSSRKRTRSKARVRAARTASRKSITSARKAVPPSRKPASAARTGRESGRPKPAALSRERRRLRDDETVPGAPSSLNFSAKASAAESGQQMYHQRGREHTEGGAALTGGSGRASTRSASASGRTS